MQPVLTPYSEADLLPYAGTGTSTVNGQAFLKTRGGEVRFGAGDKVQLIPVTAYTTEFRERVTVRGERIGPINPEFEKYRRITIADGNGNFEFKNLPAGNYYATCYITWEIPGQYGLERTGGVAYGTVKVGIGETSKVIVTR